MNQSSRGQQLTGTNSRRGLLRSSPPLYHHRHFLCTHFIYLDTVKAIGWTGFPAGAGKLATEELEMAVTWLPCPHCQVLFQADQQPLPTHCGACGKTLPAPLAGPADALWYYAQNRQRIGPVRWADLRELAVAGRLLSTDMLLRGGAHRWVSAVEVPGLFAGKQGPGDEQTVDANPQSSGASDESAAVPCRQLTIDERAAGGAEHGQTAAADESPDTFMQSLQPEPSPGESSWPDVAGYEILSELGRGGMGVVYKARQKGLNRLVALKMILSGAHAGDLELARFRAEGEAVARLQHPNIVQIYEVGEQEGRAYFSLEFVDGGSLDARLAGTPLPAKQAAQLLEIMARAVNFAHERGIVHRDLKPANVLLHIADCTLETGAHLEETSPQFAVCNLQSAIPKITDFGLAKQMGTPSGQTRTGAILGTPSYLAPEQADSKKDIGPGADIYALGAILYEMLTGRPPFHGESPLDTILMVLAQEPVAPTRLQPKVPRDLETICLQCLQKDPRKRYTTALDLAEDLRRYRNGETIRARPAGPAERLWRWCRRNPVPASLLLAVTLGSAFGLWHLSRLSEELVRSTALTSAAQQAEMLEAVNGFYSAEVVGRLKNVDGVKITHDYHSQKAAIPLPATLTIDLGNHISQSNSGMQVRLYSDHPFAKRKKDGGPRDDFEWEALRQLRQDPGEPFYRFEPVNNRLSLRYATARVMRPSCVQCHNTHPESTKWDWKENDVRGVLEIIRPLDHDVDQTQRGLRGTFVQMAGISVSLLALSSVVLLVGRRRRTYG